MDCQRVLRMTLYDIELGNQFKAILEETHDNGVGHVDGAIYEDLERYGRAQYPGCILR